MATVALVTRVCCCGLGDPDSCCVLTFFFIKGIFVILSTLQFFGLFVKTHGRCRRFGDPRQFLRVTSFIFLCFFINGIFVIKSTLHIFGSFEGTLQIAC